MNRRILVTGANGFIGGYLCRELRKNTDWWLRTVSRGSVQQAANEHHQQDIASATDAELDVLLAEVDVCFHIAGMAHHAAQQDPNGQQLRAFNVDLSVRLYRAAVRAQVQRFVWLSSSKVLGDVSATPLPVTAPYTPDGHYAQSKVLAEQALQAVAQPSTALVIVRPPLVYGPGVGANFLDLVRVALGRWPLPLGSARAPRSIIGVGNLCSALQQCAAAPAGIYQFSDRQPVTAAELIQGLQQAAGSGPALISIAPRLVQLALWCIGRSAAFERLFCPLLLDTQDSQSRLQWQPPLDTQAQLQETVSWYRSRR